MSIKICGGLQINNHRLLRLLISLVTGFWLLVSSAAYAAEIFYAAGRGTKDKGTIWKHKNGRWSVHSVIPDCSEIFTLAVDKQGNLLAGGNCFNYGTVWRYAGKGWDEGTRLSECSGLYTLAVDQNGNIWAGGAGTKNIWRYDGTKWDNGIELAGCVEVYTLAVDSGGNIWAGGEGKTQVWQYNGEEWSSGTKLSDCTEIFTLSFDPQGGTIWAGGRGGKVLWWYGTTSRPKTGGGADPESVGGQKTGEQAGAKEYKWFSGIILLDSTEISAFTLDKQGQLYAAGAGRNKLWLNHGQTDWTGEDLSECIAVYTIASTKKMVVAGGWNLQRKGRVWTKKDQAWDKGTDLKDCYVVRTLVAVDQ